jgi:hypothetical protein
MARKSGAKANATEHDSKPVLDTDRYIQERLPQLVECLINMAVGVAVEKVTEKGEQVYTVPPNRLAAEYLINRALGRPTEKAQLAAAETTEEDDLDLEALRSMSTDELIRLHRQSIGEI